MLRIAAEVDVPRIVGAELQLAVFQGSGDRIFAFGGIERHRRRGIPSAVRRAAYQSEGLDEHGRPCERRDVGFQQIEALFGFQVAGPAVGRESVVFRSGAVVDAVPAFFGRELELAVERYEAAVVHEIG